jgi:hypothetical protein
MANPSGKHGEFKYRVNGGAVQNFSAATLNADNAKIDLTCAGTAIAFGNTITVSYTKGTVVAADSGVLENFTDQAVTNNVQQSTQQVMTATGTGVATFTASNGLITSLTAATSTPCGIPAGLSFPTRLLFFKYHQYYPRLSCNHNHNTSRQYSCRNTVLEMYQRTVGQCHLSSR